MLKQLSRSAAGQAILSRSIAGIIQFSTASIRWHTIMPDATRTFLGTGRPGICIFWHNRLMLMCAIWKSPETLAMLQSPHPDGRIIASAIQRLGFRTIWGSSTQGRGGASGLINIVKTLRRGISIGITPDGPRGPRMRLSRGVVAAARLSGAPVLPMSWNTRYRMTLDTWDRLLLARPFSDGVFAWGGPIWVPPKLAGEQFEIHRQIIEDALNDVTRRADFYFGHEPMSPADPNEVVRKQANR